MDLLQGPLSPRRNADGATRDPWAGVCACLCLSP
eukprot:COSAG05_NODE_623_length_8291_cov_4.353394_4_plen_34_part_00